MTFVLVCTQCLREGQAPAIGDVITSNPPFAVTIAKGDALCGRHAELAPDSRDVLMQTTPGTLMSDEPYQITQEQIDALNTLPPGVYHVCSKCRKFQPLPIEITFRSGEMLCERCV